MASTTTFPTAIPPLPPPLQMPGPPPAPQPSTSAVQHPLPQSIHQLTPSRRHCHHSHRLHAGRHPTLHPPRRRLPRRPHHPIPRIPHRLPNRQRRRAFCHLGNTRESIKCTNTSRWPASQYPRRRPQPCHSLVRRPHFLALNLLLTRRCTYNH